MATAWHGVLAEYPDADDEERVDACYDKLEAYAPSNQSVLLKVRYHKLRDGLNELKAALHAVDPGGSFAMLDLIGHGRPGGLSCGNKELTATADGLLQQLVLAQLDGVLTRATEIRLLGCSTGYPLLDPPLPLGYAPDGHLLAKAVQRTVGCPVLVTTGPINADHFDTTGFCAPGMLARTVADLSDLTLQPVDVPPPPPPPLADDAEEAMETKAALRSGVCTLPNGQPGPFWALVSRWLGVVRLDVDAVRVVVTPAPGLLCRPAPETPVAYLAPDAPCRPRLGRFALDDGNHLTFKVPRADGRVGLYRVQLLPPADRATRPSA